MRLLLAAERSGPAGSEIEMTIALKLAAARQLDEALVHLTLARGLAVIERDQVALAAIDDVLRRVPGASSDAR